MGTDSHSWSRHDVGVDIAVGDATLDDASEIAAVHLASAVTGYRDIFPDHAPKPTVDELQSRWNDWLLAPSATDRNVVARVDGTVVGVGRASADPADPSLGHLSRLYVDPCFWGNGVGRAIYAAVIEHLRSAGFVIGTLWVLERNHRARGWYERLGWRATGARKPVFVPAGIDDVQYRLEDVRRTIRP